MKKVPCAIIGSGNIGTDLMFKLRSHPSLELTLMVGADPTSEGLALARRDGYETTADGIDGFSPLAVVGMATGLRVGIAIAKADKMKAEIQALGGTVLEYVDTPIAETSQRMPQLTTTLLQKYGAKWTHSLAINDIYFDFMGPSLSAAGIAGNGAHVERIDA